MEPYWQSADRAITVYHAPYEDVLDQGLVPIREIALTHADSPYGVKEQTDRRKRGRGKPTPRSGSRSRLLNRGDLKAHDYPTVAGDEEPFEPTRGVDLGRHEPVLHPRLRAEQDDEGLGDRCLVCCSHGRDALREGPTARALLIVEPRPR